MVFESALTNLKVRIHGVILKRFDSYVGTLMILYVDGGFGFGFGFGFGCPSCPNGGKRDTSGTLGRVNTTP